MKKFCILVPFAIIIIISIFYFDIFFASLLSNQYPDSVTTNIFFKILPKEFWDKFFEMVSTYIGLSAFVVILTILLIIAIKKKSSENTKFVVEFIVTFFVSAIISTVLTNFFVRERPFLNWDPKAFHWIKSIMQNNIAMNRELFQGFPSLHSTLAFAGFCIIRLHMKKLINRIIFWILPLLVLLSQLYLSLTWFSGGLFGFAIGCFTSRVIHKYISQYGKN
ncbi:MAG: phosphatase PAP2 family protein [Fusobacteriaceae bacterium]